MMIAEQNIPYDSRVSCLIALIIRSLIFPVFNELSLPSAWIAITEMANTFNQKCVTQILDVMVY